MLVISPHHCSRLQVCFSLSDPRIEVDSAVVRTRNIDMRGVLELGMQVQDVLELSRSHAPCRIHIEVPVTGMRGINLVSMLLRLPKKNTGERLAVQVRRSLAAGQLN